MKKLSLVLAGAFLFAGISFASPVVKQTPEKPKTDKKAPAKGDKKGTKKTKSTKPAATKPAPASSGSTNTK